MTKRPYRATLAQYGLFIKLTPSGSLNLLHLAKLYANILQPLPQSVKCFSNPLINKSHNGVKYPSRNLNGLGSTYAQKILNSHHSFAVWNINFLQRSPQRFRPDVLNGLRKSLEIKRFPGFFWNEILLYFFMSPINIASPNEKKR